MGPCFSWLSAHPAPQGRGRPRRPLCCELASGGKQGSQDSRLLLGGLWAPNIPDRGWAPNSTWKEVTPATAYGPCLISLPCSGPTRAFTLALSPLGPSGVARGPNASLHPTVGVSACPTVGVSVCLLFLSLLPGSIGLPMVSRGP